MAEPVEEVIAEYARRYTACDADGVTDLCLLRANLKQEGVQTLERLLTGGL
jgi:hypothetical protein